MTGFVPRTSAVPSVHFPGIQLVRREVLAGLPDDTPAESVAEVYPRLIASMPGSVRGVVFDATFDDVGTVEDYRRTCRALAGDAQGNVIDPRAHCRPLGHATGLRRLAWGDRPRRLRPERRGRHRARAPRAGHQAQRNNGLSS